MKIASIACAGPPNAGGIGNSAYRISKLLSEQEEVVDFNPETIKPWLRKGHGAFIPQLLWRLKSFDYIYLHYPFFGTAEIVCLFKLFHKKRPKLIIHYHMDVKPSGLITKIFSWPSLILRQTLLKQADTIVIASLDYIKSSQIKKYYFAHPKKFREIPFSLDLHKFQPKRLNQATNNEIIAYTKKIIHYINDKFIKKSRLNLLFVGGLDRAHYFKGIEILLLALSKLKTLNWRLTIIGEGDKRASYEKLNLKLQLTTRVYFAGKLNDADLIRNYQNADLLILPSINSNEAFGLVLIEALACGVPLIASDLPGVRQVFTNWREGLLVAPGDVADLKNKLEFIFNHENLRREMAQATRKLAEKKYDQNKMKIALEKLFHENSRTK